ncbi:MAG: four helix bundle protein [Lysobacteraceae bacterium]|nr:MAG: four helix bundle protein [Xanthomonadaceae bacterium]
MVTDFRDLRVWEESMVLTERVYELVRDFPADERFGLSSQIKRAAVSVPSCIAEGNARRSTRDYLRFLSMATGSLAEVQTQILLSARLGFAAPAAADACLAQHRSVAMLLQALVKSLRSKSSQVATTCNSPFPVPRSRS